MTDVLRINSDYLLQQMVGTEERTEAFKADMASAFDAAETHGWYDHPMASLRNAYNDVLVDRAADIEGAGRYAHTLLSNGFVGGEFSVNALQIIGDIYANKAQVPQRLDRVEQNVCVGMRHLLSLAYQGLPVAQANLQAYFQGVDPTKVMRQASKRMLDPSDLKVGHRAHRSFKVSQDDDGQLDMTVRYKKVLDTSGGRCPATAARIEQSDGRSVAGLLTLMNAISSVAMTHVYPKMFAIT